jgi:hypothetical protein
VCVRVCVCVLQLCRDVSTRGRAQDEWRGTCTRVAACVQLFEAHTHTHTHTHARAHKHTHRLTLQPIVPALKHTHTHTHTHDRFLRYEPFCHAKSFKAHIKDAIAADPDKVCGGVVRCMRGAAQALAGRASASLWRSWARPAPSARTKHTRQRAPHTCHVAHPP